MLLDFDNYQSAKILDHKNCTVLHHAVEYACVLIERRYPLSSSKDGDRDHCNTSNVWTASDTIESEHVEYLEIIQLICNVCPELVHCAEERGDTPLDIPFVVLLKRADSPLDFEKRLLEVYDLLKRTSIAWYSKQRKEWESTAYLNGAIISATAAATNGYGNGNNSEKSMSEGPSLMSSYVSSSATKSQNISLFKDSSVVDDDDGQPLEDIIEKLKIS